jgi:hypothetical protein
MPKWRASGERQPEGSATEHVGVESLLSVAFLEGILPVGGGELEEAVFGPAREEAEQIAEIGVRLETEHAAARDERDEGRVGVGPVLAADEEPVSSSDDLAAKIELADVV